VTSLDIIENEENTFLLMGDWNGIIYMYDVDAKKILKNTKAHTEFVIRLKYWKKRNLILTCSDVDNYFKLFEPKNLDLF
jgi:hypothetical protein